MVTDLSQLGDLSLNLAHNLIEIRQRRNLTQNELAKLVDLPRSTIANIESGKGNPSLQNLAKLSSALHTPIDQLLSPIEAICVLTKAVDTPVQTRVQGQVKIFKLLQENITHMEIDRIEIQAGFTMKGSPHLPGTKEYFHCIQGEFIVKIAGVEYSLVKGDTLGFPGQSHHSYINTGKSTAVGLSVVVPAPLSVS